MERRARTQFTLILLKKKVNESNVIDHSEHFCATWTGSEDNFSLERTLAPACQKPTR